MKTSTSRKPQRQVGRRVARDVLAGLADMAVDLRGERAFRGRKHVVHVVHVKAIREKLGMSQAEFAQRFGINRRTLQDWEQGRSAPDQAQRSYLRVIASMP